MFKKTQDEQKSKSEGLQSYVELQPSEMIYKAIINVSSKQTDSAICSILSKGLNFASTPKVTPYKEIVCGVEAAWADISLEEVGQVR